MCKKGERVPKIIFIVLLLGQSVIAAGTIHRYQALEKIRCIQAGGDEWAFLRRFDAGEKPRALAVNTRTLQTKILPLHQKTTACRPDSRYRRLLSLAGSPPYPLQNDGITHARHGFYLSTDLCPSSKKGFEKRLYKAIIHRFPHPVPVTLFITKRWIDAHPDAFETLCQWDANGSLAVTWGNHTARHHYHPGKSLRENFVLSPEENLTQDVLELEKALLERGVTPSVFFRFPGLISNEKAVQTVTALGLIPIGTDAWLAKGEKPKEGSIILVHGNGNEPKGVTIFLELLKEGKIGKLQPIEKSIKSEE